LIPHFPIFRRVLGVVVAGVLLALPPVCRAQQPLPPEIVSAPSLSSDARSSIGTYVSEIVPKLTGEDDAAFFRARDAALEPLQQPSCSVAFRIEYGRQLMDTLKSLAAGSSEVRAINAMRIAGQLASDPAVDLLQRSLTDERVSVRYAAVLGLRMAFEAIESQPPAIVPDSASRVVVLLSKRFDAEQDAYVIDAIIRALDAAGRITSANYAATRDQAYTLLAKELGKRVANAKPGEFDEGQLASLLRAGVALRDAVTRIAVPLQRDTLIAAAGYAGDLLALSAREVQGSDLSPERRAALVNLVAAAQAIVPLAADRVAPGGGFTGLPAGMNDALAGATRTSDARFLEQVDAAVGPNGKLAGTPFSFPPTRFRTKP
jgi:hypothetical protein